jgi:hypothetical protein
MLRRGTHALPPATRANCEPEAGRSCRGRGRSTSLAKGTRYSISTACGSWSTSRRMATTHELRGTCRACRARSSRSEADAATTGWRPCARTDRACCASKLCCFQSIRHDFGPGLPTRSEPGWSAGRRHFPTARAHSMQLRAYGCCSSVSSVASLAQLRTRCHGCASRPSLKFIQRDYRNEVDGEGPLESQYNHADAVLIDHQGLLQLRARHRLNPADLPATAAGRRLNEPDGASAWCARASTSTFRRSSDCRHRRAGLPPGCRARADTNGGQELVVLS